jgi:diaminopimelate epimerase
VQEVGPASLKVRTYERGVEDETLSCGTGVTACALVHSIKSLEENIAIEVLGGKLEVRFKKEGAAFRSIYLKGPATQVYKGFITL